MRHSQDNAKQKRTISEGGGQTKTARINAQKLPQKPEKKAFKSSSQPNESISSKKAHVLTQQEFKALVSQKAYELYEKRRACTDVDDWLEAERLVKTQLLTEEQGAGSV